MRVYWCNSCEYGSTHDWLVMKMSEFYRKSHHEHYRVFPGAVCLADLGYESYHEWLVYIVVQFLSKVIFTSKNLSVLPSVGVGVCPCPHLPSEFQYVIEALQYYPLSPLWRG